MRKLLVAIIMLGTLVCVQAQDDIRIVLVPGLTTDAFYITMNKGARYHRRFSRRTKL
jgi:ribose transport system substrate-binding protein